MNLTEINRAQAEVANAFVSWAEVNEIAEPPLDWAWFGEITRRYSPLHEEHEALSAASVRVDQTILAGDPLRQGNCVSACVATYLGLPLAEVPHFVEYDGATVDGTPGGTGWWWLLVGFMAARGLWPVDLGDVTEGEPGELLFVAGKSVRGVLHQVLYRDGALWHDPHPSRAGLLTVTEVIAWRPKSHDHAPTPAVPNEPRDNMPAATDAQWIAPAAPHIDAGAHDVEVVEQIETPDLLAALQRSLTAARAQRDKLPALSNEADR